MRLILITLLLFSLSAMAETRTECLSGVREIYRNNYATPIQVDNFIMCREVKVKHKIKKH